jgi:hypothetical protein
MNIVKTWNDFWFRPGSSFDLALLRMALVALQCYLLLSYSFPMIQYVFALPEYLWQPRLILRIFSFPWGVPPIPDMSTVHAVYWLTFLAGILSFVGLFTRFSMSIFMLGNILLQAFLYSFRDQHHPEAIMMLALIALALSPCGKVISVDSWLKSRELPPSSDTVALLDATDIYARWPIMFLQLFYPLMYISAVVSKLTIGGLDWLNGISLQYYMIFEAYKSDSALALYLSEFHYTLTFAELIVIVFQATFFLILFFPRLKWIYLPLGLSFHIIIYVTLRAPFPQWIVLYMIYLPWASIFRWLAAHRVAVNSTQSNA